MDATLDFYLQMPVSPRKRNSSIPPVPSPHLPPFPVLAPSPIHWYACPSPPPRTPFISPRLSLHDRWFYFQYGPCGVRVAE